MCGIVGYTGDQDSVPIILNGLRRLEYRGYDSAGIAVLDGQKIQVRRDAGKLDNLAALVVKSPLHGNCGIGHTRWATHGEPNARNAHPHVGNNGQVVLVHNGIVENFMDLKSELESEGVKFKSETDTEVIVQWIEKKLKDGMDYLEAVRTTLQRLRGAHAVVVMSTLKPGMLVAARIGNAGGVVVGLGEGENYVASDLPAILEHTRRVIFLESRQLAVIQKDSVTIQTLTGETIQPAIHTVTWDPIAAEKGEYRHFMQKEIHEQVRSLTDTLAGRVDFERQKVNLPQLKLTQENVKNIQKIIITGCGTAAHAGMIGKTLIERLARIPVEVQIASELRYADPIMDEHTLVIAVSQSGETADTLAAMEEARRKKARVFSIVNAIGSQAMRVADGAISMQVGPEIGVASTKAFTAPLVDFYLLAILLADLSGRLTKNDLETLLSPLRSLPDAVDHCLERENAVIKVARTLKDATSAFYLGRGIQMPIAYEGALKLKEVSYIHAEGYAGGEMKHGPIALIERDMPVVVIAPRDPWYEKMISQAEQVKARNGRVIAVATDGDERIASVADDILWVPDVPWMISPVVTVIPLQLLAYHIAAMKGLDVDQPRNLAKSVTVE
jgi:glucosamine--fructose-6-phosphate aminotransferase (isomerizing)